LIARDFLIYKDKTGNGFFHNPLKNQILGTFDLKNLK